MKRNSQQSFKLLKRAYVEARVADPNSGTLIGSGFGCFHRIRFLKWVQILIRIRIRSEHQDFSINELFLQFLLTKFTKDAVLILTSMSKKKTKGSCIVRSKLGRIRIQVFYCRSDPDPIFFSKVWSGSGIFSNVESKFCLSPRSDPYPVKIGKDP